MSKFNVGDKVRVRKDLVVGHEYKMDSEIVPKCTFVSGMEKFKGKIVTIKSVDRYLCVRYTIDGGSYYWTDEMFEAPFKFKVGDKVIGNAKASENYGITTKGYEGVVTEVFENGLITLDDVFRVKSDCFDLITEDQTKIVITTDGKTTTAKMYRGTTLIDEKTASCHPGDTFDFKVGAKIAFDRLVGEEEKKEEAPKGTLKIEIGKKYKLKDFDKVSNTIGLERDDWEKIQETGGVTPKRFDGIDYHCDTDFGATIFFAPEAFECEWEEPEVISVNGFKVGDRVNYDGHNATVICIAYDNELGIEFDEKCKHASHGCGGVRLRDGKPGKIGMGMWVNTKNKLLKHGELPTYYNGKVVCVDAVGLEFMYTTGKIYSIVDGVLIDDVGDRAITNIESIKYLNEKSLTKWLEVVE